MHELNMRVLLTFIPYFYLFIYLYLISDFYFDPDFCFPVHFNLCLFVYARWNGVDAFTAFPEVIRSSHTNRFTNVCIRSFLFFFNKG